MIGAKLLVVSQTAVEQLFAKARANPIKHAFTREDFDRHLAADPNKTQALILKIQDYTASSVIAGWRVLVHVEEFLDGVKVQCSASLFPYGRSSTEHDWENLGRIVRLTKAPEEACEILRSQVGKIHANRPHHWWWEERNKPDEDAS
jgi:hypothetical protein